jgi:hypothetical protein
MNYVVFSMKLSPLINIYEPGAAAFCKTCPDILAKKRRMQKKRKVARWKKKFGVGQSHAVVGVMNELETEMTKGFALCNGSTSHKKTLLPLMRARDDRGTIE